MGWVDSGLAGAGAGSALGPYGAAAGFLVGAGGALIGEGQKKKGNAMLASNPYPNMPIPTEVLENQQRAKMAANGGLPSQVYANNMKNIQRNTNNAIRLATDRRGGLGLIGTIQRNQDDAVGNLDAADAKQMAANRGQLYDINNQVAGWKGRQFDWNSKNKYNQDYNYAMQLIGAGNANQGNAFDTILSTAGLLGNSGAFRRRNGGVASAPQQNFTLPPNYLNTGG